MNIKITPSRLNGEIPAIPSKSYAHRILIASALSDSPTEISLGRISKDIGATIDALTALGARISYAPGKIIVSPSIPAENPVVNCGESGATARFLLPVCAALCNSGTIFGERSLTSRPFETLCETMSRNGCLFESRKLPIKFTGGLKPGDYEVRGDESSQYISGLLFALPLLDGRSAITLTSALESTGYVEMTLDILKRYGINITRSDSRYGIEPGNYKSPGKITVEGDWSNAAFWRAAGVKVTGLNEYSLQGDRVFLDARNQNEIEASDIPDLVPILAVCAAIEANEITRIFNIQRLKSKESDRVKSTEAMLRSLGADVRVTCNEIVISGKPWLNGGIVDGFNDHRIVMSAAIASCFCKNEVIINGAEAADKSYPGFFEDFNSLGGRSVVV